MLCKLRGALGIQQRYIVFIITYMTRYEVWIGLLYYRGLRWKVTRQEEEIWELILSSEMYMCISNKMFASHLSRHSSCQPTTPIYKYVGIHASMHSVLRIGWRPTSRGIKLLPTLIAVSSFIRFQRNFDVSKVCVCVRAAYIRI